jgi:hypothetical protein
MIVSINVNSSVADPDPFRIRMFLGLSDSLPDPFVTSTDPAPDPSIIMKQKILRKTLISTVL